MTTATRTYSWGYSSTANTGEWITNTVQLLTSVGLVSSDDTTAPSASYNADMGGVTFALPDNSSFSGMPIYLRVNFNVVQGAPYVTFYVGSAKTGTTITTPNVSGQTGGSSSQINSLTSYACYVDGTFAMVLGYAANSGSTANNCIMSVVIDRDRNTSGAAQGSGYLVEFPPSTYGTTVYSRALYGPSSGDVMTAFVPALVPSTTALTSAEGANVNVFRHYSMSPGVKPHVGMLTYFTSEFGALTPFTATVLGSAHTYLPMGSAMNYWSSNPRAQHCCAIRWE